MLGRQTYFRERMKYVFAGHSLPAHERGIGLGRFFDGFLWQLEQRLGVPRRRESGRRCACARSHD